MSRIYYSPTIQPLVKWPNLSEPPFPCPRNGGNHKTSCHRTGSANPRDAAAFKAAEINKDQPNETSKGYLFSACYRQQRSQLLSFAERDAKAGGGLERLLGGKQGRHQELSTQGSQLRRGHPMWLIRVHIWLPLVGWKQGQKLRALSVINQVQAIWGWLLQKLLFSLLDCR